MKYYLDCLLFLLEGLWMSLKLWGLTSLIAVPIAMLLAVWKTSGPVFFKKLIGFHTWFWRGTPLMIQVFFMYYAVPFLGLPLSSFTAALITFIFNASAYHTEIFRAGIESVGPGQYEAARVLGLNRRQTMFRIIVPQIIKRVLPAACNESIAIFKDTALIAAIGMGDLLRQAHEIVSRSVRIFPYFIIFVIYLLVSWGIIRTFKAFENKLSVMD